MARQPRGGRKTTDIKTRGNNSNEFHAGVKTGSTTKTRGNNAAEFRDNQKTGSAIHTTGNKESSH